MNAPIRCVCGHQKADHWRYGQMEGCGWHEALFNRCRCPGYRPISQSLDKALTELLDCVAGCERDWDLMDRIDVALGISTRRRSTPRALSSEAP